MAYHDDVVARVFEDERYGSIEYGTSRAALLATLKVKKGDKVKINQSLGTVAADASGNHTMQFQLRKDTQSLNPELWISF